MWCGSCHSYGLGSGSELNLALDLAPIILLGLFLDLVMGLSVDLVLGLSVDWFWFHIWMRNQIRTKTKTRPDAHLAGDSPTSAGALDRQCFRR